MEKEFTCEELLSLIQDANLKICLVLDVLQEGFTHTYKYVKESQQKLEDDIALFDLKIISEEYMLLSQKEIDSIYKRGY